MWKLLATYAILTACGIGFRYYRWWDAHNPDASWKAHILQWWWAFSGITAIYIMRVFPYDTAFRLIGEYVGVIGAAVIGYTLMHAYISERK